VALGSSGTTTRRLRTARGCSYSAVAADNGNLPSRRAAGVKVTVYGSGRLIRQRDEAAERLRRAGA